MLCCMAQPGRGPGRRRGPAAGARNGVPARVRERRVPAGRQHGGFLLRLQRHRVHGRGLQRHHAGRPRPDTALGGPGRVSAPLLSASISCRCACNHMLTRQVARCSITF